MEKVNYRITLDVHKGGIQKKISGFFTGDVMSRRIAIGLVAGGVTCKLEGENVVALMYVTKPNEVTNYGECEIVDNTVYYDVIQADTDMEGIVEMQLKVMSNDMVLYAPMFSLEVRQSNSDAAAEESAQFTALEKALVKAEEGKVTPKGEWNPNTTYQKWDHVFHKGGSFVALKPSMGNEPENGEYWMVSLNGAIDFKLIVDGSTPAGDSVKFDGKNSSFYASTERLLQLDNDLNVERERINNIASLKEGSTTGDAELTDGRIDHTGKKWDNIGAHIRGVTGSLKGENEELFGSLNMFRDLRSETISSTGSILSSTYDKTTNYISVSPGEAFSLYVICPRGPYVAVSYFDSSKNIMSQDNAYELLDTVGSDRYVFKNFTVPEGVSYIRVTARYILNDTEGYVFLYKNTDVVQRGNNLYVENMFKAMDLYRKSCTELNIAAGALKSGYVVESSSTGAVVIIAAGGSTAEKYTEPVMVNSGETYKVQLITKGTPWIGVNGFTTSAISTDTKTFNTTTRDVALQIDAETYYSELEVTIPDDGTKYVCFSFRTYNDYECYIYRTDFNLGNISNKIIAERMDAIRESIELKGILSPFWSSITPRKTRYVQHRGLTTEAPENSLPAFYLAGEKGCFGVECDVLNTKDGVLVVSHDDDISKTTDGTGKISEYTYEELLQFHIDTGRNVTNYTASDLVIPTFEEYVRICKKYGMFAVIELKYYSAQYKAQVKEIVEILYKYGMQYQCYLMFNDLEHLDYLKVLDPKIHAHYLHSVTSEGLDDFNGYINFGFDVFYRDYESYDVLCEVIRKAESMGFTITVYTTQTDSVNAEVFDCLPDFITTDLGIK